MIHYEIAHEVRLTDIPSALERDLHNIFTVTNPKYLDAIKQRRHAGHFDKYLHFCKVESPGVVTCPRGAAGLVLAMARKSGQVEITDNRLHFPEIDVEFAGTLRPYQHQATNAILEKESGVLEAGTGSGKTVMGIAAIAARKQPTLILVHTKELLYQWRDRIEQFLNVEPGLVGDGRYDLRPVTVGIVNSTRKHLPELSQKFGHLVVDECHRVPSTLFTQTVSAFPPRYLLGLSATPYRRDGLGKLIGWSMGIHRVTVDRTTLHQTGAILRPKVIRRKTDFWYQYRDDYLAMISALIEDRRRNQLIAGDVDHQAQQDGLSLVVSDRTSHLQALANMISVKHAVLTGKTPAGKRREIVGTLSNGDIRVLLSTTPLISEGFDCPALVAVFLASPVKFSGRLLQVVGRVLRPEKGKQPVVFDYIDQNIGVLRHQAGCRQKTYSIM